MNNHTTPFPKATLVLIILIVGLSIVLGGFIFLKKNSTPIDSNEVASNAAERQLLRIKDSDHVYGNRDADIVLVKYSDAVCQYCRFAFPRLLEVVDSHPDGEAALVYRYLPVYNSRDSISQSEIASECVAKQLGDEGFFAFTTELFSVLPEGQRLDSIDESILLSTALKIGVDESEWSRCTQNFTGQDKIRKDHTSGGGLGVIVLPHTFIVSDEEIWEIGGAKPLSIYQSAVENLRAQSAASTE